MIGRAGRPQYDSSGVAHVMVQDSKKSFYKKFLHEPFPVESSLHELEILCDHINAEISSKQIPTIQKGVDYLTYTYFYRRLKKNPTYYNLDIHEKDEITEKDIGLHLSKMMEKVLKELLDSGCVQVNDQNLDSTSLGTDRIENRSNLFSLLYEPQIH